MSDEKIFLESGKRVRTLRGALTQADFAERLGVNRKTVERWEAGERLPDGQSLLALMSVFSADVNYILKGERSSTAPALTADEREMLALFKSATLTGKAAAIGALQGAAGASHTSKIHIAGGAHHGQIADVIHNTTTRTPARPRRS